MSHMVPDYFVRVGVGLDVRIGVTLMSYVVRGGVKLGVIRGGARTENLGRRVEMWGYNLPPLIEVVLTDGVMFCVTVHFTVHLQNKITTKIFQTKLENCVRL